MLVADVILEQTAFSFDKPYGYLVPENLADTLKPGCRVVVPFGQGNTRRQGMVLAINESDTEIAYKSIERVLDAEPILSGEMLDLCEWMHERYFCTYFDAVKTLLPSGMSFTVREVFSKGENPFPADLAFLEDFFVKNETVSRTLLLDTFEQLTDRILGRLVADGCLQKDAAANRKMGDSTVKSVCLKVAPDELDSYKLTPRQREIAELAAELGTASVKEIVYFTGVSQSV